MPYFKRSHFYVNDNAIEAKQEFYVPGLPGQSPKREG